MIEVDSERILWLTVIRQAVWDSEGRGEIDGHLIYLAKRWLTTPSRAFYTVCSLAGISAVQADFLQESERKRWKRSL
ncbi:MAG TPA: hypothetical protein VI386_17680 [Candidatus Sulfotelmatobacter sp.]